MRLLPPLSLGILLAASSLSLASSPPPAFLEIESKGEIIPTSQLLVPGSRTLLFFYSPRLEMVPDLVPFLRRFTELDPRMAVRLIDIDRPGEAAPDLASPIARSNRITRDALPFAKFYSPTGRVESRGQEALGMIEGMARSIPPPATGKGPYPPEEMTGEVEEITNGNDLEIKDYLSDRAKTIVLFHSPFCPPCRKFRPALEELAKRSEDYILRKVDVNRPGHWGIDNGSPVSQAYGVPFLPYVVLYDKNRERLGFGSEILQTLMDELMSLLRAEEAKAKAEALGQGKTP